MWLYIQDIDYILPCGCTLRTLIIYSLLTQDLKILKQQITDDIAPVTPDTLHNIWNLVCVMSPRWLTLGPCKVMSKTLRIPLQNKAHFLPVDAYSGIWNKTHRTASRKKISNVVAPSSSSCLSPMSVICLPAFSLLRVPIPLWVVLPFFYPVESTSKLIVQTIRL